MLARVVSATGELVALHRTYLTWEGQKAPVPKVKKFTKAVFDGATTGGAIRLFEADRVLGVAEGIETALACHLATGLPVWAAGNRVLLEKVVVPSTVREVVVFGDNDVSGDGQRSAQKLARRLAAEGKRVKVLIPDVAGTDWADDFVGVSHG
ncbi:MAG TPA: toprim domain-containing protein [Candidatus Obscuribacterales bacterium]